MVISGGTFFGAGAGACDGGQRRELRPHRRQILVPRLLQVAQHPETRPPKPETRNPKPETETETRNPKSRCIQVTISGPLHFALCTLDPTLSSLPSTLYCLHYTLHSTLCTHSTLYILHPTLYTLLPTHFTLHRTLNLNRRWMQQSYLLSPLQAPCTPPTPPSPLPHHPFRSPHC